MSELATVHDLAVPVRTCRCGRTSARLRRFEGEGPPLCDPCWLRCHRARAARSRRTHRAHLDVVASTGVGIWGELAGRGLAPRSVGIYARRIQTVQKWFRQQGWYLATATAPQVAAYAATTPFTWSSRSQLRAALGHYWEIVERERPPLKAIRCPKQPPMVCKALGETDARALARYARLLGDRAGMAVLFGLYQGMRRAEIASVAWADIDVSTGRLTILGKGAKTRHIPLHPVMVRELADYPMEGAYIFPGRVDGHASPATVSAWMSRVADDVGIAFTPHWLRFTAISTMNDATGDLRTTQSWAGHARPETTSGYSRVLWRKLEAATAAIDYS